MKYYVDEENKIFFKVIEETEAGVRCTTIYDDDSCIEDAQMEEVINPVILSKLKEIQEPVFIAANQRHLARLKKLIRGK